MSSSHVVQKVRERLTANWATTPIVSDTWLVDDDEKPPADASYWVALDFPGAVEEKITVGSPGSDIFRESGVFQVHVFGPAGGGDVLLRTYAETIRGIFRAQTFESIRCYGADPPLIGLGHEDGRWLRATVAVEYEHDLLS